MATAADAEVGWQLFQDSHYSFSLDEINRRLRDQGFSPVSSRMYQHYRKLVRYGFATYLPINQLDVKTLQDPAWDAFIRGRAFPYDVNAPVIVRFQGTEEVIEFRGRTRTISDAYVVVVISGSRNIETLSSLSPILDLPGQLQFSDSGEEKWILVDSIVIEPSRRSARVRLRFLSVQETSHLSGRHVLPDRLVRLRFAREEEPLLGSVVQQLQWAYQAVDSSRAICEELLSDMRAQKEFSLGPPRVTALSLQSPLELLVEVGVSAALVLLGALEIARSEEAEHTTSSLGSRVLAAGEALIDRARESLRVETGRPSARPGGPSPRLEGLWLNQLYPSAKRLVDSSDDVEATEEE